MNAKVLLACLVATVGSAGIANAQVGAFTLDWLANGSNAISVSPGDIVTVTGVANWTPAAHGLGSAQFRVDLGNSDATDALQYAEILGLGRNPSLRMLPQAMTDTLLPGGRSISGIGGAPIDAAQAPQFINPLFNGANPIEVFRFMFIAGDAGRTIEIGSPITAFNVYANAMGMPAGPYAPSIDGAQNEIVPTPGSLALVGVGGLACLRRRRRS
jgi:uncharacterized protein (TIGR03382 family)